MQVNEQGYWENRFASKDWEQNNGREQTKYFGALLLEHLPRWLKSEWAQKAYSICDMGCAEGDCAGLLAQQFPCSEIFGADFSRSALDLGRINYPAVRFLQDDIYTSDKQYDVIVLSNVLEHLEQPEQVLRRLLHNAQKYVVVMVPLDDDLCIAEHINHFSFDSFQNQYNEGTLCYHEWIYCGHPMWPGYQLLLVYVTGGDISHTYMLSEIAGGTWEKDAFVKMNTTRKELENQLAENNNQLDSFTQQICELKKQNEQSQDKIQELVKENEQFEGKIDKLMNQNQELHCKLQQLTNEDEIKQKNRHKRTDRLNADNIETQSEIHEAGLEFVQEKLIELQQYTDECLECYKEQTWRQLQFIQTALEMLQSTMASRTFRLLHLYNRIKCQLFAGNWSEKKMFFKWLFHRSSVPKDISFQPLSGPYRALMQANEVVYVFPKRPTGSEKAQKGSEILENTVLPYGNLFLQIKEKKKAFEKLPYKPYKQQPAFALQTIINECFYKGIFICPSEEEDSSKQWKCRVLHRFAKCNWLCLLCGESSENMLPQRIEDNVYFVNECDAVRTLRNEKVVILLTNPQAISFADQFSCKILWFHAFDINESSFRSWVDKKAYELAGEKILEHSDIISYEGKIQKKVFSIPTDAICLMPESEDSSKEFNEKIYQIQSLIYNQFAGLTAEGDNKKESKQFFEMLQKESAGKRVVIFPPTIDWNMPMFQRPQQLACAYARKENTVVIYLTPNYMHENIDVALMPRPNIWVVNAELVEHIDPAMEYAQEVILSVAWATNQIYLDKIRADKIIYEYIDDLTIFYNYGPELIHMHEDLLHRANLTVCTATSLYSQVKEQAQKAIVSTNACDYELFKTTPEAYVLPEIQKLAEMYSHVIGYYGALAKWFDYDLVKQVAQKRPDWLWLLVGIDYDNSMEKAELNKYPNIVYAGLQPYEKLPGFLKVFDVATLPFKINDITKGTSPVKIFEYMAGNKPIVTAQLPECMKYDSIFTYQDADDFCRQVEKVIALKPDDPYWETLKRDALHNTWDVKTDEILAALSNESN